jgi:dnd system-associated protein 4
MRSVGASRIRIAKDKAELVQALIEAKGTTGPFQTYADAIAFAAAVGSRHQQRSPLGSISTKEPAPISIEVFLARGYDPLIKLIAIAEVQDTAILSPFNPDAEEQRVAIFEEYANGGLEWLREELRGAVDYTERLLLILNHERFKDEQIDEDFDLSRFL